MKRGALRRHTPLRSAKGILRGKPIMVRGVRTDPGWDVLRRLVYARAGGVCDCCAQPVTFDAFQAHHRRLRSQGGADTPENVIALTAACHTSAHNHPAWAQRRGLIVPSWLAPETVPVLRHGGRWELPGKAWKPSSALDWQVGAA